jgi:hypothetical protein
VVLHILRSAQACCHPALSHHVATGVYMSPWWWSLIGSGNCRCPQRYRGGTGRRLPGWGPTSHIRSFARLPCCFVRYRCCKRTRLGFCGRWTLQQSSESGGGGEVARRPQRCLTPMSTFAYHLPVVGGLDSSSFLFLHFVCLPLIEHHAFSRLPYCALPRVIPDPGTKQTVRGGFTLMLYQLYADRGY